MPTYGNGHCCAAINCSSSRKKTPGISMFRFPKDAQRCEKWVINTRSNKLINKSSEYLNRSYRLCSKHFELSQFMNPNEKCSLIQSAIPTIFDVPNPPPLIGSKRKLTAPRNDMTAKKRVTVPDETSIVGECHISAQTTPGVTQLTPTVIHDTSGHNILSKSIPAASNSTHLLEAHPSELCGLQAFHDLQKAIELSETSKTTRCQIFSDNNLVSTSDPTHPTDQIWSKNSGPNIFKEEIQEVGNSPIKISEDSGCNYFVEVILEDLSSAVTYNKNSQSTKQTQTNSKAHLDFKKLEERNVELRKALRNEKVKVYRLKQKLRILKQRPKKENLSIQEIIRFTENILPPQMQSLFSNQLSLLSSGKKWKKWTKTDKTFALSIYDISPRAYTFLREVFALPSPGCLQRNVSNISRGFIDHDNYIPEKEIPAP